jgi:hypothetical protein
MDINELDEEFQRNYVIAREDAPRILALSIGKLDKLGKGFVKHCDQSIDDAHKPSKIKEDDEECIEIHGTKTIDKLMNLLKATAVILVIATSGGLMAKYLLGV